MKTLTVAAATLALMSAPAGSAAAHPKVDGAATAAAQTLIESDRRFGREAAGIAGVDGLVRTMDDDVVLFAVPVAGFARGKSAAAAALIKALGGTDGATEWTPVRGGVSADGTHGFTLGYMTTRVEGRPPRLAKYVSYWVKTRAGWRVRLFKRVPRPEGEVSFEPMPPSLPQARARRADGKAMEAYTQSLREREQAFSDEAQRDGLSAAFARFGSPDAMNVGGGPGFTVSAAEIAKGMPTTSPLTWAADQGVLVAPSGDLGVTWGYLHRTGPTPPGRLAEIPFFTVWRRAGIADPWLYLAE